VSEDKTFNGRVKKMALDEAAASLTSLDGRPDTARFEQAIASTIHVAALMIAIMGVKQPDVLRRLVADAEVLLSEETARIAKSMEPYAN